MNTHERHELIARIARQRGELANAYRDIARPIQYAEQGMRGFAFLRQNPWVFSVVPAALTMTSALVGIIRNKPSKKAREPRWRDEERRAEKKAGKSLGGHALTWGLRGWKVFRLYSKIRKFM